LLAVAVAALGRAVVFVARIGEYAGVQ